jgi:hypothetical protein
LFGIAWPDFLGEFIRRFSDVEFRVRVYCALLVLVRGVTKSGDNFLASGIAEGQKVTFDEIPERGELGTLIARFAFNP